MKPLFTQRKIIHRLMIMSLLVNAFVSAAGQTSHTVNVTNNKFTPGEITIDQGDQVTWTNSQGFHNVNGMQSTFPSNPGSFGNDVGAGWTFSHVFSVPGTYQYQCDPHVEYGMVGTIIVQELQSATLTVNFKGMTPHLGEMLTLYVKELSFGEYIDTVVLAEITGPEFSLESSAILPGRSYSVEFYADHNGNGSYDAPPADHAWRLQVDYVTGNTLLDFTYNTGFVDIFQPTGLERQEAANAISVFPNPATDRLDVRSDENIKSLTLYGLSGTWLRAAHDIGSADFRISLEGLEAGIYILEVWTESHEKSVQRIVKK